MPPGGSPRISTSWCRILLSGLVVELELLVPDVRRPQRGGGASTVVMNPNSGPGSAPIPDYQRVIDYCHARGQHVIAYVHTSYGGRTAAAVKADIDTSYAFCPGIDGIFLDEMSNAASTRSYYQYLYAAIKAKPGVRDVVGNPGAAASTSWQLDTPVADEVVGHIDRVHGPLVGRGCEVDQL